jgi:outer membrane protein assembly factor BamB/tRNA A-37 threonylcarbamoyl transferase component Bud32
MDAKTLPPDEVPAAGPLAGTMIRYFGDYELLEEIARGGMGVVYKARQVSLNRIVALKMILAGQLASAADVQRFRHEAQMAAHLQHPHIVAIHEVGEHDGQHYFSMDYVVGKSLAQMVQEAPLPPAAAARYVRIIAETIHFAHQQGILHRDLKPSNVLIDGSDQPRVTDFGLAKRVASPGKDAGAALTATGAVLGTPSYMPPEQASADRGIVGVPSDVYSLGAVLYELVTGRPPFRAATAIDTIMQVLHDDPVSPRLLNPQTPRDLETVILKCLAKEPAKRYGNAQELADDLAAFLDGRPVKARRPGPTERAVRWFRRQKRSVALATATAVVMALAIVGGFLGWLSYQQAQLGHLSLDTNEVALVADIFDEHGQKVVQRVGIPTEEPVALPDGSYRMRLFGRRALSQDYQLLVERGQSQSFRVGLDERQMWEPLHIPRTFELLSLQGRTDVILMTDKGISRVDGATKKVVWETILDPKVQPLLTGVHWDWKDVPIYLSEDRSPRLVSPAPDLDGDGTGDVVVVLRDQAAVLALSGKEGKVLWCHVPERPGNGGPAKAPIANDRSSLSTVVGLPAVTDVDGDGIPDFIVAFAAATNVKDPVRGAQRWVEAISGRSGKSLWRRELDDAWFALPAGAEAQKASTWFVGNSGGHSGGGTQWSRIPGEYHRSPAPSWSVHAQDPVFVPLPPQTVKFGPQTLAVLMAGTRLVGFDARNGAQVWACDMGFLPPQPPKFADFDGDQLPDALLLQCRAAITTPTPSYSRFLPPQPATKALAGRAGTSSQQGVGVSDVVVVSLQTGKILWRRRIEAEWGAYKGPRDEPANWPIVVDLDGDGRPEVIVPHGGTPYFSAGWPWREAGLAVLNGADGQPRWHVTRKTIDTQFHRFIVGPDIDGDGHRDVFVASLGSSGSEGTEKLTLFVDALSGKDGHTLWLCSQPLQDSPSVDGWGISPLLWWQTGDDGWPQLLVPYSPSQRTAALYILSAGTGQLAHVGMDLRNPQVADLDGDGTPDLVAYRPKYYETASKSGGDLYGLRGTQPEFWRKLGSGWRTLGDLNGDGVPDLVQLSQDKIQAVSGKDGKLLWQATGHDHYQPILFPPLLRDYDGDGIPDVLLLCGSSGPPPYGIPPRAMPLLKLLSGRDGHVLWTSDCKLYEWVDVPILECRDLDGDGRPEILIAAAGCWDSPASFQSPAANLQLRLVAVSGQTGATRWQQPLSVYDWTWGDGGWGNVSRKTWSSGHFSGALYLPDGIVRSPTRIQPGFADLNGDGILDLIVPATTSSTTSELRALNGRDGKILWQRPLAPRENNYYLVTEFPVPAIGDLDGDGKLEVVILDYALKPDADPKTADSKICKVLALNGADGTVKWSWQEEVFAASGRVTTNGSQWDRVNHRPRPLLFRSGARDKPRLGVCVWAWGAGPLITYEHGAFNSRGVKQVTPTPGKIVILDSQGRELRRFTGKLFGETFGVWSVALDGNGDDELVSLKEGRVTAVSPTTGKTLWEWPLPKKAGMILSIQPGGKNDPAIIVIKAGDTLQDQESTLYGLSAATGKPRWRCKDSFGEVSPMTSLSLLPVNDPAGLPLVLYTLDNQTTVCRQAVPLEPSHLPPSSKDDPAWFNARPGSSKARLGGANLSFDDPRLRRFSWNTRSAVFPSPAETLRQIIAVFLTLVLPGWVLLRWIRRGPARLGHLVAAAVLVALWFALLVSVVPSVPGPFKECRNFLAAMLAFVSGVPSVPGASRVGGNFLAGVLLLALLVPLASWTAARRWRRVPAMLALYAAIALTEYGRNTDYFAGLDWHDGTGWYVILLPAAYLTGAAMLVLFGVVIGAKAVRQLWRAARALRAGISRFARGSAG